MKSKGKVYICPGLSSPASDYYRECYRAVSEEARRRGFDPELIYYPGQRTPDGRVDGNLSLSGAVAHACASIEAGTASDSTSYRLIGFSFGCFVALRVAQQLQDRPPELVTLWGPLPYWKCWENFREALDPYTGAGTRIPDAKAFFSGLVPIEYLLAQSRTPVHVNLGDNDEYTPPAFLEYLKHGCCAVNEDRMRFTLAAGCSHTMEPLSKGWTAYVDALFHG